MVPSKRDHQPCEQDQLLQLVVPILLTPTRSANTPNNLTNNVCNYRYLQPVEFILDKANGIFYYWYYHYKQSIPKFLEKRNSTFR